MVTFDSTDLDNAASESGVVHESTTNTDHNDASNLKQGYPYGSFDAITPTPVSAWPFHEDSGSTAYDLAGTNDGGISGATVGQTGILGTTAYSFDVTDDLVDCGTSVLPDDVSQPWSLAAWVKPSTTDTAEHHIVCDQDNGDETYRGWTLRLKENEWDVALRDDTREDLRASAPRSAPNTAKWFSVVATYNGGGSVSDINIYENGDNLSTTTHLDQSVSGSYGNTCNTSIGARDPANPGGYFGGDIADVRIYDTALTSTEIQTLYDVVATSGTLTTQYKTV